MNPARAKSIMANASSVSKKVYEAVPIQKSWPKAQIVAEVMRNGRAGADKRMIEGCLDTLKSQGLIKEPEPGRFVRVNITERKKKPMGKLKTVEKGAQAHETESPLELLARLSDRARRLSKEALELSADVDAAAVAIDDAMTKNDQDTAKLRQLQALLKDLG